MAPKEWDKIYSTRFRRDSLKKHLTASLITDHSTKVPHYFALLFAFTLVLLWKDLDQCLTDLYVHPIVLSHSS